MNMQTGNQYAKLLGGPEVEPMAGSGQGVSQGNMLKKMGDQAKLWLERVFKNDRVPRAASFSLPPI